MTVRRMCPSRGQHTPEVPPLSGSTVINTQQHKLIINNICSFTALSLSLRARGHHIMDRTASHYRTLVSRDKYRYIGILRCFVLRYWIDIQKQCYRFFYWEFTCIYCVFLLCVAIQTPAASVYRFHYDGKTRSRDNTGCAVEASILPNLRSGPADVWQTVLAHWWQKRRGHSSFQSRCVDFFWI